MMNLMSELELINLWGKARLHIIVSQMAPTFLLIVTVGLLVLGLSESEQLVRYAALGILLASGTLGALVQYSAATDALAVSRDLATRESSSLITARIIRSGPLLNVVRFVTPTIFIVIFVLLALVLL